MNKYQAEPFRIKVVEPIRVSTPEEREEWIQDAGYNVFKLRANQVYVDCLTDSGTSAMSTHQWSAMMLGDESYAGCDSFFRLEESAQQITGFKFIQPTHQGRAADYIMAKIYAKPGSYIIGNMHFDSFRGHAELLGAKAVDMIIEEGIQPKVSHPFKGNIDTVKMENFINEKGVENIPLIIITVTCNNNGGQPVSMANVKEVSSIAKKYNIPLMVDAARFSENAYFIKEREPGYSNTSVKEIVKELFSYTDGSVMSSKKDGLVNIGGLFCTRNEDIHILANQLAIVHEGFITYGGQSGRDMDALAVGLQEVVQDSYLENRIGQVRYLGERLKAKGVPIVEPIGGHGIYVDAKQFAPHIPQAHFPAQSITIELYKEAGVRAVELGTCAFGSNDPITGEDIYPDLELMRIAISRRVYTNRHMDVIADALGAVYERRDQLKGLELTYQGPIKALRHFTARFKYINS